MTEPFQISQGLIVYLIVGLRFIGMFFTSPVFVAPSLPLPARFWAAVLISIAAVGSADLSIPTAIFSNWISIILCGTREFFIGTALGFLSALPLYALQVAGELIGNVMGLAMVSLLDPLSEEQSSIIGQLYFLIGLWFFFHWNGHLLLVQSVVESLKLIPIGKISLFIPADMGVGLWLQKLFVLAVRMVLPFYGALLLADIGLGFLARTVPQMNIFVLGLPFKIALGLFLLMVVLPLTVDLISANMREYIEMALKNAMIWKHALL